MLHYIILGIIEGFTEFLPISSTGHLVLYNHFAGLDISSQFLKTFEIAIQLGAILAVVVYYFKEFLKIQTLKLLAVGVLPTIIIGFVLKNVINDLLEMPTLIAANLILGGIIILITERIYKDRHFNKNNQNKEGLNNNSKHELIHSVNYNSAVQFGIVQSLAMMPGVSRSGAIIVYGLLKNFERETIAKFSFLLAVPTMCAATGYSLLKNYKLFLGNSGAENLQYIAVGFTVAFLVALIIVRYALPFIKKYSFVPFGIYRIILGVIILISIL